MTNSNHRRAAAQFAQQFQVCILAHRQTFPDDEPSQLTTTIDGDEISNGLRVIGIEGAAPGEIALHYSDNGGTLIVGDALVNFEPYGFSFLPPSIARMKNRCAAPCKNFCITRPSEFFLHMARRFSRAPVSGSEVCSTAICD